MNADVLLEHFHRLGDAPDAVPRLRRFMLQLAVEGAFQTEAQLLTWTAKPLGDLCEFKGGLWKGKKPPFVKAKVLRVTNITKDCEMNVENAIELDVEVKQLASRRLTPGDIIIEKSGGGDNQPVGRVALFTETEGVYSFSNFTTVMRIVDHKLIAPDFLHDFLRSFYFIGGTLPLQNNATNLRNLQLGEYKQVVIPLPPLPEQQRIVAKVDELMALCDRLEAAQQRREQHRTHLTAATWQGLVSGTEPETTQFALAQLPALTTRKEQIAALRQTILDLAVRGRLVKQEVQGSDAQSALELNDEKRVVVAKEDRRADANKQPIIVQENRWSVPIGWDWRALADLVLFIDYRGKTPNKTDSGVRLVTAKNVRKGYINVHPEEFLSQKDYTAWMTRGLPKPGDVLFTTEAPMGNAAVVLWTERFALAQRVIDFRSYGALVPEFLALQINAQPFQVILDKTATGLTAKGIKASKLKRLPIAVPPLGEQKRIVAKVDELMALCDRLEAALEKGEAAKARLLETVLARSDDQMIGRSDDGMRARPSGERLIAKAVPGHGAAKTPRACAEVEVALPMAAEPVPQRRGPGRPRKAETQDLGTVTAAITGFLQAHPGWHARSAIVPGAGIAANTWNAAINALLEAGKVERQGKRKGARYRVKK